MLRLLSTALTLAAVPEIDPSLEVLPAHQLELEGRYGQNPQRA